MIISRFVFICLLTVISFASRGQSIERVEPPSWWIGMKDTSLQLMIYGEKLSNYTLGCVDNQITVIKVYKAESPNYIFADISINSHLKPGLYRFYLTNGLDSIYFNYSLNIKRAVNDTGNITPSDLIYLIMPDRFANGDVDNDNHPEAVERADYYNHYGRHGGDIKGIINNLDYISELGVTVIWSTPMLFDNEPKSSYHGYACSDFYRIDPRLGDNELYKDFVSKSKKKGIKVIMDIVPNHCALTHWWMEDLPFKDWINVFPEFTRSNYAMTAQNDIHSAEYDKQLLIRGWFDNSMPDMNLTNSFVYKYLVQNAVWWVEWAGLSGLRVDTFPYSDKYHLSKWVEAIKREYPQIYIVGESWYLTPQEVAYWEGGALNRDGYNSNLTSVMDFPLQEAIHKAFNEDSIPRWGEGMFRIYRSLSLDYIYSNPDNLLIFPDNHDTHRIAATLGGSPQKMKMMLTMLATMRGTPQIYYGTEVMLSALNGEKGHGEERVNMPGGWDGDLKNVFKGVKLSDSEASVLNHFKKIFNWRKGKTVIHSGKLTHYWPEENLYIYFRYNDKDKIMVVINNDKTEKEVLWKRFSENICDSEKGTELLSGKKILVGEKFIIQPQSSAIIEFE